MKLNRDDLHEYQKYGVDFIINNPISALMLECGLGKTITTLTAINNLMYDLFEVRKVLIIAPLRVARDTWSAEIEKWEHLKPLRYSIAVGTEEERLAAQRAAQKAEQERLAAQNKNTQTVSKKSTTVYVTPTGKRYHYSGSCNGGTYIASTLEKALARGLTPCKKCVG